MSLNLHSSERLYMMKYLNNWLTSRWSFFVGLSIVLIILILIPFLLPGGKAVINIIGDIAIGIVILLALVVLIFRVFRK